MSEASALESLPYNCHTEYVAHSHSTWLHIMLLSLLLYPSRSPVPLCSVSLGSQSKISSFSLLSEGAFPPDWSSKSKYQNAMLWLCFLRGVDNWWVKKETVQLHPLQVRWSVWEGVALCAVISAWGPHQTQYETLSRGDRRRPISQVAFYWLIAQWQGCYLNPQNAWAK